MDSNVSRRAILKGSGALLGLAAAGQMAGLAWAAEGEVAVLGIVPLTGPYAADGERIKRGQEMAIADFAAANPSLKIRYVSRDSAGDAGIASRRVTEAIESENVIAIAGPWADDVAAAVDDIARRNKRVHFWSGGPLSCHRYYFQWAPPYYSGVDATMRYIAEKKPDGKRWYMLSADYSFGWTLEDYEKEIGADLGIEFVGSSRHVLGEREFSPYMTEIAAAKPDVLILNNFGLDTAQALRAAASFGLGETTQILVPWGSGIEDYLRLDPSITAGVVIGTAFYYTIDNPVAQSFAKRYIDQFGEPPGYPAGSGYAAMALLLEGLKTAKTLDPQGLATALEGWEGETVVGATRIDAATHQTFHDFFVTEGKKAEDVKDKFDLATIVKTVNGTVPAEVLNCPDIGQF